jgi:ribA/ribD-fused uncharacterized protein
LVLIINKFEDEYAFLSNFYPSPVQENGIMYPTIEHYFQAQKTTVPFERAAIANAVTPGQAKREGRRITLRKDWEQLKDSVMLQGLRLKFAIPELAEQLLATGDAELVEGTTWHDNVWGNCSCPECENIPGENRLGKLLMQVREEIKNN